MGDVAKFNIKKRYPVAPNRIIAFIIIVKKVLLLQKKIRFDIQNIKDAM